MGVCLWMSACYDVAEMLREENWKFAVFFKILLKIMILFRRTDGKEIY